MTLAVIAFALYVLSTAGQIWWFTRDRRRLEEEASFERRELTDRIMALSSKPESLVAVHREEVDGEVTFVGTEKPWYMGEE